MAFCTYCGKELNPGSAFCTYCGAPVSQEAFGKAEEALNLPNSYSALQSNDGSVQAINHEVFGGSGLSEVSTQTVGYESKSATGQVETRETCQRSGIVPPNDLLANWKTDWGMLVLGIFTIPLVFFVLMKLSGVRPLQDAVIVAYYLIALMLVTFQFFYSIRFYPSYFSTTPLVNDRKLVSYLNGLGGSIFGIIWSINMAKNTKGHLHAVAALVFATQFITDIKLFVEYFIV